MNPRLELLDPFSLTRRPSLRPEAISSLHLPHQNRRTLSAYPTTSPSLSLELDELELSPVSLARFLLSAFSLSLALNSSSPIFTTPTSGPPSLYHLVVSTSSPFRAHTRRPASLTRTR